VDLVTGLQSQAADVDFEPLVADARELAGALDGFVARRSSSDSREADRWNRTAIRLGRILNPVMYSRAGRFHHDPADWSPLMRATKRFTMPGLNKAEALAPLKGQPEAKFLKTQIVREINRTRAALREAIREVG
jgi:hypothetical protein